MCLWQLRLSDFKTYPELSFLLSGFSLSLYFCFFVHPWIHGAWNNCSLSQNLKHFRLEQMCYHPVWVTGSYQVPVSIYVACVLCIPALNILLFCNYKLPAGFTTFGLVFMSAGRKPSEEIWSVLLLLLLRTFSFKILLSCFFLFFISSRFPFETSVSMFWLNFFLLFSNQSKTIYGCWNVKTCLCIDKETLNKKFSVFNQDLIVLLQLYYATKPQTQNAPFSVYFTVCVSMNSTVLKWSAGLDCIMLNNFIVHKCIWYFYAPGRIID